MMISINEKGTESCAPELYQLRKIGDKYIYDHLEEGTHKNLEGVVVNPLKFFPKLESGKEYEVELLYGPNIIYVYQ